MRLARCGVVMDRATELVLKIPDSEVKSDQQLMLDIAEGDAAALGQLYLRHSDAVRAMIGYVAPGLGSYDVDDVTQEVFLSLGKAARSYRHQSLFNAFLYRIAANRTRDWLRRKWLRLKFVSNDDRQHAPMAGADAAFTPLHQPELNQIIRQILGSLSYAHREVLVMNVIWGLTCDEIAGILKIRPKTVRTRLYRARSAVLQHRHAAVWKDAISEIKS